MSLWKYIASGFGVGFAPKAPGTCGSLLGLILGCMLLSLGHGALLIGIVLAIFIGTYAIRELPDAHTDPGWIVIDEIAGQMLPLLALGHVTVLGALIAFLFFRLFDILKPGPVGWLDKRKDAYGVMGDDLVAGLLALLVMIIIYRLLHL